VLADAHTAGAQQFVLGGDYAAFGAFPGETVERLRELDAIWIRGNTERWAADPQAAPPALLASLTFCANELGHTTVERLAALPQSAAVEGVRFCHASPRSDMETFMPQPSSADDELLADDDEDVVVFGHSHLQFKREAGERLLLNPGSVGIPFDGDRRAAYALWDGGAEFELRRVGYDWARYVEDLRLQLRPAVGDGVETFVRRVEQAAFVD
jgi:diadenosine tetraphosphatase ApaH/serine/threonine PP2A family protein phosphatase